MNNLPEGDLKDLVKHLITENILMHSQIAGLRNVVKFLFVYLSQEDLHPDLKNQMVDNLFQNTLNSTFENLLVSHPLMEPSWKNSLREALGDIEGLDLNAP